MLLEEAGQGVLEIEQELEAVREVGRGLAVQLGEAKVVLRQREEEVAAVLPAKAEFIQVLQEATARLQNWEKLVEVVGEEGADLQLQLERQKALLTEQEGVVTALLQA
jgi:hypothetical protein